MNLISSLLIITLPAAEYNINRGKATVASVVLPGVGQMLSGAQNRGEVMLWIDGALWATWAGFSWYRATKEEDAKLIARAHANADITIKDPRYYRLLERYNNAEEYNEDIRREARGLYPDDPDAQRRYYESRGYFGESQWHWDSDSIRIYSYWQTRKQARAAGMTASFLVAGLLLNRLVSLVDCMFFIPEDTRGRVGIKTTPAPAGLFAYWRF